LRRLTHLSLSTPNGRKTDALPQELLRPLSALEVLELDDPAIDGPHLQGLSSLRAVTGFRGDIAALPPLPRLAHFEVAKWRGIDQLEQLMRHNPDLVALDLRWHSGSPLWFDLNWGELKTVARVWERFARLLAQWPALKAVQVHHALSLARTPDGSWLPVFLKGKHLLQETGDAQRLASELSALFQFAPPDTVMARAAP
jgi:hypothetical protein